MPERLSPAVREDRKARSAPSKASEHLLPPRSPRSPSALVNWSAREREPDRSTSMTETNERVQTDSGIELEPVYDEGAGSRKPLPGHYPFTRGIYPDMYRRKRWTMRQYSGFGTAAETNERFRYLLSQGQTGLSVAFDLPTQMGYDSDNAR